MKVFNCIKSLKFIFKPSFWVMNYSHNPALSEWIENSLEAGQEVKIVNEGLYQFKINGVEFWGHNYPYAFGITSTVSGRPSRLLIEKLHKLFSTSQLNNQGK